MTSSVSSSTSPAFAFTSMIPGLVHLDGSPSSHVPDASTFLHGRVHSTHTFNVQTSPDGLYGYLGDHVIGDTCLFPVSGHVVLAWTAFARTLEKDFTQTHVGMRNVQIHRAIVISTDKEELHLTVTLGHVIPESTDEKVFHISDINGPISTGFISTQPINSQVTNDKMTDDKIEDEHADCVINTDEIYQELRLRGYKYGGDFRVLKEMDIAGCHGKVTWKGNWATFLEAFLQEIILVQDNDDLRLPIKLSSLTIDPVMFNQTFSIGSDVHIHSSLDGTSVLTTGIHFGHVDFGKVRHLKKPDDTLIRPYTFQPYITQNKPPIETNHADLTDKDEADVKKPRMASAKQHLKEYLTETTELVLENSKREMKVLLYNQTKMKDILQSIFENAFHHDVTLYRNTKYDSEENRDMELGYLEWNTQSSELIQVEFDLVIVDMDGFAKTGMDNGLLTVLMALREGGFLLTYSGKHDRNKSTMCQRIENNTPNVVHVFKSPCGINLHRRPNTIRSRTVIQVSRYLNWKEELWTKMLEYKDDIHHRIWLTSDQPINGVTGLVKYLRHEPGGENVRAFVCPGGWNDQCLKEMIEDRERDDLVINIFQYGVCGSYRNATGKETRADGLSRVEVETPGDLTSLHWTSILCSHLASNTNNNTVDVCFATLNFRDVMIANAKMNLDYIDTDKDLQGHALGIEFVGIDYRGKRVMGIVSSQALATTVSSSPDWTFDIPDHWSLEAAATVPVAYCTAYYALVIRGNLGTRETVLIHSGTSAMSQAAIAIALSHQCRVFTTVGNEEKRQYLLKRFPGLRRGDILSSNNTQFATGVMEATNGKGVNVLLNTLAGDKFLASLKILAPNGRFLEAGKGNILRDKAIGMKTLLQNTSILGIHLDLLQAYGGPDVPRLKQLVEHGIESGVVQPLDTKVFHRDQIVEATKHLTKGSVIGKIVIKIRDEDMTLLPVSRFKPRVFFSSTKTYIIIGNRDMLGLEWIRWMIDRGAKHFVLIPSSDNLDGFQQRRIRALKKRGADIKVQTVDLTQYNTVEQFIRCCTLPVGGVFHLPETIQNAALSKLPHNTFNASCTSQIASLDNLDKVTRDVVGEDLDWFVVVPGSGGDYDACNSSYMERVCEKRHTDKQPGLALRLGLMGQRYDLATDTIENTARTRNETKTQNEIFLRQRTRAQSIISQNSRVHRISSVISSLDNALSQSSPVISVLMNK